MECNCSINFAHYDVRILACVTNCNECHASGFIGETYCVNCAEGFFGNDCQPKLTGRLYSL